MKLQVINNNNFVIKKNFYFIKKYSKKRKLSFDREIYFYNYFKYHSNILIPKILKFKRRQEIVFKYYPFKKINSQKKYFDALLNFFYQTNIKKKLYKIKAKERYVSVKKLKRNIEFRILNIKKNCKNIEVQTLLKKLRNQLPSHEPVKNYNINKMEIISQSDLGVHNAGVFKKKIYFFDFEYSGTDNVVKFLCDVYYQPELNVNINIYKKFIYNIQKFIGINLSDAIANLEPYYKIKMILIILKIFNKKITYNNVSKKNIYNLKNERLKKAYEYLSKKTITSILK